MNKKSSLSLFKQSKIQIDICDSLHIDDRKVVNSIKNKITYMAKWSSIEKFPQAAESILEIFKNQGQIKTYVLEFETVSYPSEVNGTLFVITNKSEGIALDFNIAKDES
jgi:hypothetical protein